MEKKNFTGLCILFGLLAIAVAMPFSMKTIMDARRNVTVRGLCEKEVKADRAIWPVVFKVGGNSLVDLGNTVAKDNEVVTNWLKQAGLEDSEISVASPKVEDLRASYGAEKRPYDYLMTSVITVCTDKVDTVQSLLAKQFELLRQGIAIGTGNSWEYPVEFTFNGLNEIKPEMIEQATLNARAAAEKFAKDSGSRVGKIISATQGQFTISDRDSNTPYIKTVRVVTSVNYGLR